MTEETDATIPPEDNRIGEVVETRSGRFTVQCYRLYESPPLGALVSAGDPPVYAVVSEIVTKALDPGRPVIARGQTEPTEDALHRNNPQLEQLLCTRFQAATIGWLPNGSPAAGLPPLPPRIHSFVYPCQPSHAQTLALSPHFLHLLLNSVTDLSDEAIVACLNFASRQSPNPHQFLLTATKSIAHELSDQLPRLNALLGRLS